MAKKKALKEKKPVGRPTKYSQDLAERICEAIATSNRSLVNICKDNKIGITAVFRWLDENEGFRNQYARARECQADFLADELISISDDSANDTIVTDKGEIPNNEWINRSRLRVDARKWVASKLKPKKYGDKIDVTTAGEKLESVKETFITLSNGTKINL